MGDLTALLAPQPPPSRKVSHREDCWTEEATFTLLDTWGFRYLELNRGYLRQKDWQEVADVVNARHGHTEKACRTDAQCKNRIDALKKKYKVEKAKISQSNGTLRSTWLFFSHLERLIESNLNQHQNKLSATPLQPSQSTMLLSQPSPPMSVPLPRRKPPASSMVTPLILPQKRPAPSMDVDESFRRNYSMAAAAAAAAAEDEADVNADDGELEGEVEGNKDRTVQEESKGKEGIGKLAHAIQRFGEIYEKVESMKLKQIVELEKQRMQFAKDLTVQGMQLFMDTLAQLEKLKQAK